MELPPLPQALERLSGILPEFVAPSIHFSLDCSRTAKIGESKVGGQPDLPEGFEWPKSEYANLDFLLKIDLATVAPLDPLRELPSSGLLSFFYDLHEQPWGFDPTENESWRRLLHFA